MKKLFLFAVMLVSSFAASAQNFQVHYDFGEALYDELGSRHGLTTTMEMYKPDKYGATFGFIDLNYKRDGATAAYMEIFREISLMDNNKIAAHFEYNGGLASNDFFGVNGYTYTGATRFQHAFMTGAAYNWHNSDFSKTWSLILEYKYYMSQKKYHNGAFSGFQATTTWGLNFCEGMFSFLGFADVWYDQRVNGNWIFVSQPQFWFNLNKLDGLKDFNLSIGTEVELSNNFIWNDEGKNNKFYAIPTLGAKWTF